MVFRSFIKPVAILAALLGPAGTAEAQVIEIDGEGHVTSQSGPAITTVQGATPLARPGSSAQVAAAPQGWPVGLVAGASTAALRMVPMGTLATMFQSVANESGVDARLLHAVAWQESRFRHARVSPKGAVGIMQLMPGTARDMGVDPRDLLQNLRGGARLLAKLLRQYNGNLDLTLAAYNAGPDAVRRWGGIPPYAETRDYVRRIKSALFF